MVRVLAQRPHDPNLVRNNSPRGHKPEKKKPHSWLQNPLSRRRLGQQQQHDTRACLLACRALLSRLERCRARVPDLPRTPRRLDCEPENTFQPLPAAESLSFVPSPLRQLVLLLVPDDYRIMPIQLHALSFAVFAALIAPFGGFFASGLKRALKLKDFGDSIPGHGGLTDRMDCQCIMAMFSYIYIQSVVGFGHVKVDDLLEKAMRLSPGQQQELYKMLGQQISLSTRRGF